jgi:hypothetical protein
MIFIIKVILFSQENKNKNHADKVTACEKYVKKINKNIKKPFRKKHLFM